MGNVFAHTSIYAAMSLNVRRISKYLIFINPKKSTLTIVALIVIPLRVAQINFHFKPCIRHLRTGCTELEPCVVVFRLVQMNDEFKEFFVDIFLGHTNKNRSDTLV